MKKLLLLFLISTIIVSFSWAQEQVVNGKVRSADEDVSLPGVSILIVGTTEGTVTDAEGDFKISVPDGGSLQFSYIGYVTQEIVVGNQTLINVSMVPDVSQLQEIVVTSFGIEKEKRAIGYAIGEVEGTELIKARELNLGDALQGRVAGVNVSNIGSGVAGSSRVIIRGNTSLSGRNEPLYILDGVPMDNSQRGAAGMWGGSDWGDGMTSINPDDIENMTVLKGNAAAALYGSRASNGVILITTKQGKARKGLGIEFNSTFTAENFINNYDFQQEYGHGTRGEKPTTELEGLEYGASAWGAKLDGSQVFQFDGVQRPYSYGGDNFKNYYRTGMTFSNTLALTGGRENQTFRFSFADMRNQAITPHSGMNRQNISLSTNSQWAEQLTLTAKLQYSREDVQNRSRLSDAPGNGNYTLVALPPSINVVDLKGTTEKLGAEEDGTELQYANNIYSQNPYWAAYQFDMSDVRNRIIGSGLLRWDITDFLYAHARLGIDWHNTRRTELTPYGTAYSPRGQLWEANRTQMETNLEYLIGYDDTFGNLSLNVFFGGNRMRKTWERLGSGGNNFNVPFLHNITNLESISLDYDYEELGINSLFGSAEVSWKNLIYLNATVRNDWFSTLPVESNSILYPSVSASWVFGDTFSMPSWWTDGKLRAAWGEVGGGTSPYQLDLAYGLVGQGHQGATMGRINNTSVPNSQLVPLTKSEWEIGFDVRFLANRLGLDYTYYSNKTEEDILSASIAETSGYGNATVNVGEITNKGHEVLLTGTPVARGLRWDISLNFAYNDNQVERLYEESKILSVQEARSRNAWSQHRIAYTDEDGVDHPGGYSVIVGYKHLTIGGVKVYDDDGLPVRDAKLYVLGEGVAPFVGGMNNSFNWKNFGLSFLIDFKSGGDIFTGTNMTAYGSGLHKATLEGRETGLTIEGVNEEGTPQTWNIPGTSSDPAEIIVQNYYGRYNDITEYFVEDASYVKLRQLVFSYNFPQKIIGNTPIQSLSLSFVGRNLWLIHSSIDNVDPESTYNTSNGQGLEWLGVPQTRSYGFNLLITF
jgi:TonB-linked SusC/RagA family outer membrane protein